MCEISINWLWGASNVQKLFVFFGDGHASVIDWAITEK